MKAQLAQLLEDKDIEILFADEAHPFSKRAGWATVADVGCNAMRGQVAVPRRRFGSYHVAEVLHEVAHLEIWRWKGRSPAQQNEVVVCSLACDIARQYGFEKEVVEWTEHELAREVARRSES